MRIGTALLTAAMMLSGIVVVAATSASAQTYAPSGYQSNDRPAYQAPYRTGYQGGANPAGRYDPRGDGYTGYVRPANATVVYEDTVGYTPAPRYGYGEERVAAPVYEQPAYAQPVYDAPRYVAPTYVRPSYVSQTYTAPRYVAPVEQCHERGW